MLFRSELFAIVSPLFMQWVVDHALVTADQDLLLTLVLGFGFLLILQTAVSAMRDWIAMVFGASLKLQGRSNLFSHLIRLPANYFESRYLGDIVSRFGSQETIFTGHQHRSRHRIHGRASGNNYADHHDHHRTGTLLGRGWRRVDLRLFTLGHLRAAATCFR